MGKDPLGKRKRKVLYGESEKEVIKKANSIVIDLENGDYVEPNKDTLIDFLKEYHKICSGCDMWKKQCKIPEDAKWEETTAALNKMYIDVHFEPYFKQAKLIDIKPMILDKFYNTKLTEERKYQITVKGKKIDKIANPLSINSVRKLNTFLKSAFNYAVKNQLIKSNPTDFVALGKKSKYTPTIYKEDQFLQLLDYVMDKYDRVPVILGAGMGFRRGEIFGLTWNDINFEDKTIAINKTRVRFDKTLDKDPKNESSNRIVSGPDYVFKVLEGYKREVMPTSDNDKILNVTPGYYSERFKWLLEKFKMPHIRLHDLRHYNAVIMMNKGIPDKVAAGRLGHSDVTTLREVYQHVLKDMDENAANKINEMFRKNNNSHEPGEE